MNGAGGTYDIDQTGASTINLDTECDAIIADIRNKLLKLKSKLVEFGIDDIVRSGLVKQYLTAKHELGLSTRWQIL